MSQTLQLTNFSSNNVTNRTTLTGDYAAGVSALGVVDSVQFITGLLVLIGTPGNNNCEILTTTAPANPVTVSLTTATQELHNHLEQVAALFGAHLRIYRSIDTFGNGTQPLDTSFSLQTTIPIDPTNKLTNYTDPTGSGNYWYKYTFYNTTTLAETSLADSKAVRGDQGNNYTTLDAIRGEAGFSRNLNITNDIIDTYRQDAQTSISGTLAGIYNFPLPQPTNPIIERITRLLAAGELMKRQYRLSSPELVKEGQAKIDEANGTLLDLNIKTLVLNDATFTDTTVAGANGFSAWPDATTDQDPTASGYGLQHFTPDDRY